MRCWLVIALCACLSCGKKSSSDTVVAVSASFYPAALEIAAEFEKKCQCRLNVVAGPTGALLAQLQNGAPYDVFISANHSYAQKALSLAGKHPPELKILAKGALVFYSHTPVKNIWQWLRQSRGKVALANPKTAPYGLAAKQALQGAGLYGQLRERLLFARGIGQVNQFLRAEAVSAGFSTMSALKLFKGRLYYQVVSPREYDPVYQTAVLLNKKKGSACFEFLFSAQVKNILLDHHYQPYE